MVNSEHHSASPLLHPQKQLSTQPETHEVDILNLLNIEAKIPVFLKYSGSTIILEPSFSTSEPATFGVFLNAPQADLKIKFVNIVVIRNIIFMMI